MTDWSEHHDEPYEDGGVHEAAEPGAEEIHGEADGFTAPVDSAEEGTIPEPAALWPGDELETWLAEHSEEALDSGPAPEAPLDVAIGSALTDAAKTESGWSTDELVKRVVAVRQGDGGGSR